MTNSRDKEQNGGIGVSLPWPPTWAGYQHRRKVVQIILWQGDLCALCDDGTIHYRQIKNEKEYEWFQVPDMPDGCEPYPGPDLIGRPVALEGGWTRHAAIQLHETELDDGRALITGKNLPGFNIFVQQGESVADEVNRALAVFWPAYAMSRTDLRLDGSSVPPWEIVMYTKRVEL